MIGLSDLLCVENAISLLLDKASSALPGFY
jgi:hypothetical protein